MSYGQTSQKAPEGVLISPKTPPGDENQNFSRPAVQTLYQQVEN